MHLTWLMCLWLIQGAISARLARRKGRNPYLWFTLGCFFGLLGILAIVFMKPVSRMRMLMPQAPITPRLPHFIWYYLDEASKQQGPLSSSALESAFREGKIQSTTYVWREEMPEWERFEKACQDLGIPLGNLLPTS